MEISSEKIPSGAARSLGLSIYRRDYISHAFTEVQIDLWWRVIFVSLRAKATSHMLSKRFD
jgi:hypothetical protein